MIMPKEGNLSPLFFRRCTSPQYHHPPELRPYPALSQHLPKIGCLCPGIRQAGYIGPQAPVRLLNCAVKPSKVPALNHCAELVYIIL